MPKSYSGQGDETASVKRISTIPRCCSCLPMLGQDGTPTPEEDLLAAAQAKRRQCPVWWMTTLMESGVCSFLPPIMLKIISWHVHNNYLVKASEKAKITIFMNAYKKCLASAQNKKGWGVYQLYKSLSSSACQSGHSHSHPNLRVQQDKNTPKGNPGSRYAIQDSIY